MSAGTIPGSAVVTNPNKLRSNPRRSVKVKDRAVGHGTTEPLLFVGVDNRLVIGDKNGAFKEERIIREKDVQSKKTAFAFRHVSDFDREDNAGLVPSGNGGIVVNLVVDLDAVKTAFLRPTGDIRYAAQTDEFPAVRVGNSAVCRANS